MDEKEHVRFFGCIGNPPYHEETEGTSDVPMYDSFMDAAYTIADKVMLITPGRFLFNAGKTPKKWNEKMLRDPHFKVEDYEVDSTKVFPRASIKGGVAITYHDVDKTFEPVGVFSPYAEMRAFREKMSVATETNDNLSSIMFPQNKFDLDTLYADYPNAVDAISNNGNERRIVSSAFMKLDVFSDTKTDDSIGIVGLSAGKRTHKWIRSKYVEDNGNLTKYKVIVPKANGSGAIGEVLSTPMIGTPMIGTPMIGYTQTFIGIGAFDTELEAQNCMKYIKTKFARTMLGILKVTPDNPAPKWIYVPLQDYTTASDIDWSQSIADIDQQLYSKYGLSDEEIAFIEEKVKAMD